MFVTVYIHPVSNTSRESLSQCYDTLALKCVFVKQNYLADSASRAAKRHLLARKIRTNIPVS